MEKSTREKVALVVFALLIAFTTAVLVGYFSTGRSWTRAATFVDDTVGEMEGYSVIVYYGTVDPADSDDGDNPGASSASDSAALSQQTNRTEEMESVSSDSVQETAVGGTGIVDPANSLGLRILSMYPKPINESHGGVFVSDVRELYERKDAAVVTLDTKNPSVYSEPIVIRSGEKKVGVFSALRFLTRQELAQIKADFQDSGVDTVVCITPRTALLADNGCADIIIVTDYIFNRTEAFKDTDALVVQAPDIGQVGVILLSPNNVATPRAITAL